MSLPGHRLLPLLLVQLPVLAAVQPAHDMPDNLAFNETSLARRLVTGRNSLLRHEL